MCYSADYETGDEQNYNGFHWKIMSRGFFVALTMPRALRPKTKLVGAYFLGD